MLPYITLRRLKPERTSLHRAKAMKPSSSHMGKLTIYQTRTLVLLSFLVIKEIPTAAGVFVPDDQVKFRRFNACDVGTGGPRRVLAPFQLCLQCRCCAANDTSNCSSMPCCFGIDCDLPDKPYGVCAFVPKTCNCTSCA